MGFLSWPVMLVSVTATHFIKRTHSQPLRNGKLWCELKDTRRGSWSSSMGYCHIQQEYRCDAHIEVRNGTMTAGACRVCKPELCRRWSCKWHWLVYPLDTGRLLMRLQSSQFRQHFHQKVLSNAKLERKNGIKEWTGCYSSLYQWLTVWNGACFFRPHSRCPLWHVRWRKKPTQQHLNEAL